MGNKLAKCVEKIIMVNWQNSNFDAKKITEEKKSVTKSEEEHQD